jgi:hypothetical protein
MGRGLGATWHARRLSQICRESQAEHARKYETGCAMSHKLHLAGELYQERDAHLGVTPAGATLLEGCRDQVILVGSTQIPTAAFCAGTGTQQTLASSVLTPFSETVTVTSTSTLAVGMLVSAANPGYLSPNTAAAQVVNSTTLLLNQPALQSPASASLTFWTVQDGTVTATAQSAPVFIGGTTSLIYQPLRMGFKVNISNALLNRHQVFGNQS